MDEATKPWVAYAEVKKKKKSMITGLIKLGNLEHWWLYMSVALKS